MYMSKNVFFFPAAFFFLQLKVRSDVIMKQEEVIESKDRELKALKDRINAGVDLNNKENESRVQHLEVSEFLLLYYIYVYNCKLNFSHSKS